MFCPLDLPGQQCHPQGLRWRPCLFYSDDSLVPEALSGGSLACWSWGGGLTLRNRGGKCLVPRSPPLLVSVCSGPRVGVVALMISKLSSGPSFLKDKACSQLDSCIESQKSENLPLFHPTSAPFISNLQCLCWCISTSIPGFWWYG